jgi:hypothetical protein
MVKPSDTKPNFVLQQRINDSSNTPYIGEHNLGDASFQRRVVENGFLVDGKLTASKSWDFAGGSARVPSAP